VIGWRLRWADSVVVISDRRSRTRAGTAASLSLYAEKRGEGVDDLYRAHRQGGARLPLRRRIRAMARPESNTFTAWITRTVPELEVDLPATAIGKDYLRDKMVDSPPAATACSFHRRASRRHREQRRGLRAERPRLELRVGQSGLKLSLHRPHRRQPSALAASAIDGAGNKP